MTATIIHFRPKDPGVVFRISLAEGIAGQLRDDPRLPMEFKNDAGKITLLLGALRLLALNHASEASVPTQGEVEAACEPLHSDTSYVLQRKVARFGAALPGAVPGWAAELYGEIKRASEKLTVDLMTYQRDGYLTRR